MLVFDLFLAGIGISALLLALRSYAIQKEWFGFAKQCHLEILALSA